MMQITVLFFFVLFVVLPVFNMLMNITAAGFTNIVNSPQFVYALKNSLICSGLAAIISVTLALLAAFCTERTETKFRRGFNILFVIPMLIPSISHAFGLIALFGSNGIFTKLMGITNSIYGYTGIIAGSVMYSFPVVYLMLADVLRYEDGSQHKAAKVLGVPALRRFTDLTLPFLRKPLISALFASFTMIITDYGVPLMIGGKILTLPVLMYNKAVGMIDYNSGSVIGAVLLLPSIVAFTADMVNSEKGRINFVHESVSPYRVKIPAFVFCVVLSVIIITPIVVFCMMTFAKKYPANMSFSLYHLTKTIRRGAGSYLLNSLLYAVSAGTLGTILAFMCSYITARLEGKLGKMIHLMSLLTMSVPGIVLGLSYVILFSGSYVYGTILIIVLVNLVHFFASPYIIMLNALRKINPSLEDIGAALGIPRIYMICDVIIPKVAPALREMFAYFFVNSMMTISAVSFLAPPSPRPVALMIPQFEAQLLMESAAFVSLIILAINSVLKIAIKYQ